MNYDQFYSEESSQCLEDSITEEVSEGVQIASSRNVSLNVDEVFLSMREKPSEGLDDLVESSLPPGGITMEDFSEEPCTPIRQKLTPRRRFSK